MGGMELPFLFANAKAGSAALDQWYRKYAAKEMAGRPLLPHLRARSGDGAHHEEEDRGAR